jgi:predicted DsbA family dithiol-disulfide isomerase
MINISDLSKPGPRTVLHWFDFLCPYCYVGQSRDALLRHCGLDVIDLPFQAHADIPKGGIAIGPRVGPAYTALELEALDAGLELIWPPRLPDTRPALAASEWVREHAGDASIGFNTALFAAHFEHGEDLGDLGLIDRYARRFGIDIEAMHKDIDEGSAGAAVTQAEAVGRRYGVRGTPAWLIRGELISGLRPTAEFERLAQAEGSC